MSRKRYTPEQIIGRLREAEALLLQSVKTGEVCRPIRSLESVPGQQRKSPTTFVMSVRPPKAEVTGRRCHFRFVPQPDMGAGWATETTS